MLKTFIFCFPGSRKNKIFTAGISLSLCLVFLPCAYGALEWRGNQLEGEFSNLMHFASASGNSQSSFLDEGTHYASEMNLRMSREKVPVPGEWAFEAETTVRKTDD